MMFVGDELVVVTTSEPVNGEIGCFALGSIINLRHKPGELTGNPAKDLTNGYDVGAVKILEKHWRSVRRWFSRGDFITLKLTASHEYRFGFVTREQLLRRGVLEVDLEWVAAWCEATDYEYERIIQARKREEEEAQRAAVAAVGPPRAKSKKKVDEVDEVDSSRRKSTAKQRRERERWGIEDDL